MSNRRLDEIAQFSVCPVASRWTRHSWSVRHRLFVHDVASRQSLGTAISGGADLQGVGAFKDFVEDNEKGAASEGFAVIAMVLVPRIGFVFFFVFLFGVTAQAPLGMGVPERAASMVWLRGGTLYVAGLSFYFLDYMAIDALMYVSAPDPAWGRGDTPRWGLMAGFAACCTQYIRCCPLFPVQ